VIFMSTTAHGRGRRTRHSQLFQTVHPCLRLPADWHSDVARDIDLIGGPRAMVHYRGVGAWRQTRRFASTRDSRTPVGARSFLFSWPKGIDEQSAVKCDANTSTSRPSPTLLELTGVERPKQFRGVEVVALDGASFAASLNDSDYLSAHHEQYSEFMGNRSFYKDGWKLVTLHRPNTPYDDQEWELYDIREDPRAQQRRVRTTRTGSRAFSSVERSAWDNKVFPLNDFTGYMGTVRRPLRID